MSLSRTCLSVRKYCRIFSFKKIFYVSFSYSLVYLILRREFAKNGVKTITVFAIIYHSGVILNIDRELYCGSKSTVNPNFSNLFLLLVIMNEMLFDLTLYHGIRNMNRYLMDRRRIDALNSTFPKRTG